MRRTTDLLDVFRERPAPTRPAAAKRKDPSAPRGKFEGLFLYPRQLLLGSSVVVLLLVFAFVLGLSMGRRGASDTGERLQGQAGRGAAPAADEPRVYAHGWVPYMDTGRQISNEPLALREWLTDKRGVALENTWIADDPHGKRWILIVGPFADRDKAMQYLLERRLVHSRVGGAAPFENVKFESYLPSQLPRERLPRR